MKCKTCGKVFDDADRKLDSSRLTANNPIPGPGECAWERRDDFFGAMAIGIGEFAPLCVGCYCK
jgi:hypothetical protein